MFNVVELKFNAAEHKFNNVEHTFSDAKLSLHARRRFIIIIKLNYSHKNTD